MSGNIVLDTYISQPGLIQKNLNDNLDAFFKIMTELITNNELLNDNEESSIIARTRTILAFDSLDGVRKGQVLQFLYESDQVDALFNVHSRSYDGTSSIFRKNIITPGSNKLNENYDRDVVAHDAPGNNVQSYDAWGASLKLDFQLDGMTLTSISALALHWP